MNADSEFLKLCREMRDAQRRLAFDPQSGWLKREAAKLEYKFDTEVAVMVNRREPSLFDGES